MTKYQVLIVGIIRTMLYERSTYKRNTFCHIPALPPTTLGWPGLQWVYAQSARTCIIKGKVARIAKFGTIIVYDGRHEFRDGAPTADGVLLFDHPRSPAIHSRKKEKKTPDGWEEPREHDKRCRF